MTFPLSSLTINCGRTSVLCSVSVQESVPNWMKDQGKGWLNAEYRLLPGSTPTRNAREVIKLSGRTQEIQRLIARSLRSALDLNALGERTLLIDCDVLNADAGTRTTSITGAWVALHRACKKLIEQGFLSKDPLKEQVAAVSVGLVDGIPMLDLDYSEDSRAEVDLNVVMDSKSRLIEVQGTAEGNPFTRNQFHSLLDLAELGLKEIRLAQQLGLK